MKLLRSPLFRSLLVHGILVGLVAYRLATDPPQVAGGEGLAGRTQTHFDVTVSEVKEAPAAAVPPPVQTVSEGLEVLKKELPTEVKNETREIETPPEVVRKPVQRKEVRSEGSSPTAAPGAVGQGGTGNTRAERLGNSDRTNTEGVYLLKLQQKIQENLESVGYIDFDRKAMLQFIVRKNGLIEEIKIQASSGDRGLDRKAVQAVQRVRVFLPRENDLPVQVPVLFPATR